MEQKSTTKEVDKSQEIASCRKSISEIVITLKEEVRLLTVLLDKLTILDRANWLILRYKFHRNIERLNCQDLYSIALVD